MSRSILFFFFALFLITKSFAQSSFEPASVIKYDKSLVGLINQSLEIQRELVKDLPKKEQKLALQYIKGRSEMISDMLKNGNFLLNSPLNVYLDNLFKRILTANPDINSNTTLLLSRSGSVNAFTTGDGFFVLNLGLLTQLKTESELAFVIGHELSHQSLDHVNQSLREKAELEADPDRIKEINRIMRSEYQVSSKLSTVILPGMIASRQFKRNREFEADSLGYLYATRSGFSSMGSIAALEILDSVDVSLYGKNIPWHFLYESMECSAKSDFENVSIESSLGSFEVVNQDLVDQLKTHPDCELRIDRLINAHNIALEQITDSVYESYRTIARMELIESYRIKKDYGAALYHALQLQFDYPENEFALESSAHYLGLISLFKKQRRMGEYVNVFTTYQPEDYGKFLKVIWEATVAECSCLAYNMNAKVKNPSSPERHLATMAISAYSKGEKEEAKQLAGEYTKKFPKGNQINRMNYILKLN